ncbi:heavy-metal-associated domain-containing protein [uncultured Maribacter sp.]|uniref:heavy-metal-associated domain-containing protein n=1 Tax=uncultured Maribacter sp. TaxID=431308 RepID=UPI0030DA2214|tara:strand:- start:394 stop:735 length:342 start_codon:yes stop_codon:yes gene_type:complete
MKNIILIPVLALVLFSVEATAQNKNLEAQKVETSVDEQNLTTVHFKITGITCAGCSNGIYKAVKAVDGVTEHSVEYPGDIAVIQFDKTKTSMEALKAVIEKKGYKVELLKDKV